MKILATGKKNGRKFVVGSGTYEEVKALNVEKSFSKALEVLAHMRKTRRKLFGVTEPDRVNRTIYGTRKASRR